MPNPIVGMIGSSVVGGMVQSNAASKAAGAQSESAEKSIAEQRRQFDDIRATMAPFIQGGTSAFNQMAALAGVGNPALQNQAINQIASNPEFKAQYQAGEDALLQNASATGGLRGGNTQALLAQLRPAMLDQEIDQAYARLGGLAQMGQAAAGNQAAAGQNFASSASQALQSQGAAQAGAALARGNAIGGILGDASSLLGMQASGGLNIPQGSGLFGKWGF